MRLRRPVPLRIETDRLRLCEVTPADAEFLLRLMNEPAYLEHIGDRGIRTIDDARSYIESRFVASYAKWGYGLYRVSLRDSGGAVGICGFVRRDSLPHADLGFAFLVQHWSRGLALEACRAVVEHGFGTLGMETVLAVTSPGNAASIRLLEKLGFRRKGQCRVPPNLGDSVLFALEGRRPARGGRGDGPPA